MSRDPWTTVSASKKQRRQLAFLQQVNQLVASDKPVETIFQTMLHQLTTTLGYEAAQIYQLSDAGEDVWLYLEAGHSAKPVTQTKDIFSVGESNIISDTIRRGKPTYVQDINEGPYSYFGDDGTRQGSELALPLEYGPDLLGVLKIQAAAPGSFDNSDRDFLSSLAALVASTMRNHRKIGQLQDSIHEIKTLYSLQYRENIEHQQYRADHTRPVGYEYDRNVLVAADSLPALPDITPTAPRDLSGIVTSRRNGQKELLAPIRLHGETIGLLGLEDSVAEIPEWSKEDIGLLEEVTTQVALAIENARLLQRTQKQTNELSILFEATRQLTETIDLQQIYNILTTQMINYLGADRCSVLLLNPDRTHFESTVAKTRNAANSIVPLVTTYSRAIEEDSALQTMIKQPQLMIRQLDDPGLEPGIRDDMSGDPDQIVYTRTQFPLMVRGRLIGLVEIEHLNEKRNYNENELQLAQAVISQVTVAIENAELFQQTQEALTDTQKLYDISRQLVESTSTEDIFDIIIENVKSYDVDRVSISLIDWSQRGEIDSVTIVATWDRDPSKRTPVGAKFSTKDFSLVETFAKPPFHPLISEDLRFAEGQDDRMDEAFRQYVHNNLGAITLFSAPMFLGTEYKGVLSIYTRKPHKYARREVQIYQTLADQAIIAIENYRLLETTRTERDRASLLYKLGQTLSYITTVEQVQEVLINYVYEIGATDGEFYITDGDEFVSISSTIPERRKLPPDELAAIALADGPEALALSRHEIVVMSRDAGPKEAWPLQDQPGMDTIQSFASIPFFSQRSSLQGVLTFFHKEAQAFSRDQVSTFESIAIQTAAALENVWLLHQTNKVLQETELLYNVTRGFNSAQSVEDLLSVMVDNFATTAIEFMSIALVSETTALGDLLRLEIASHWSREAGEVHSFVLPLPANEYEFVSQLRATGHGEYRYRHLNPKTKANIDKNLHQVRTILAIPMAVGSNWLGVLLLASRVEDYDFKLSTIRQISALSGQAAIVMQNLHLGEETQKNLRYSEILSSLGQQLLAAETAEAIYDLALSAVAGTNPDRGASIFIYDQKDDEITVELAAAWDNPDQARPAVSADSLQTIENLKLYRLLEKGQTVVSNLAAEDDRFPEDMRRMMAATEIGAIVAVPLWIDKQVGGTVLIANEHQHSFSAELVRLYEDIARETSGALENRRLFDQAQHRAWQLQTAADISQAATAYLDLDTLLFESVDLIKERFKFYHASIFLVDEYRRYAVVQASTGSIGRKMLDTDHKLAVGGRSVVGTAMATGKPRVALDVGPDTVHFDNPLLPDTRSEVALPLIAQGQVIGALDVQSDKQNAFSESDLTILQSMANQLANAIEAARAYREAREALEEVSKLHQRYLLDQWNTFLKGQSKTVGFELVDNDRFVEVNQLPPPGSTVQEALEDKKPVVLFDSSRTTSGENDQQEDKPAEPTTDRSTLVAPLTLHGQSVIGTIDLEMSHQTPDDLWDEDTLKIVEAVSGQAAQAIESARLFEQTQIAREEAEALYQVGRALVTADTEQDMFNTVLDKMLTTIGLKQGGVLLIDEDGQFGKLHALFRDGRPARGPYPEFPIAGNLSYEALIETKRPVTIEDMATDPLVAKVRELGLANEVASLLLVPIIIDDEVIGAIGADSVGETYRFTEREKNLALAMANQLSIALQNRRLIEETRRKAILLQASADVGRVATSILDQDELISRTVALIQDRFGFHYVEIFLIDGSGQGSLVRRSGSDMDQTPWSGDDTPAIGDQSVIGQTTAQRQPVVMRHSGDQSERPGSTQAARAHPDELGIPLQVGSTLIGAIGIQSTRTNDFTDEDIATLETLAAQLAVAVQNARAFKQAQETAERLKEIDKLKTQFLANMSHELRTPLNSIIGFSRVILKGIDGPLTDLQKTDLTSIHSSGQHLLGLINNILDLSKIEAGKMELNFEETEVEPIVKTIMATAVALVKDKPVTLQQEIPEDLPTIWADPTRIRQILLNLVSNACKFTEEGTVTVRVAARQSRMLFSVTDTGIGIPGENLGQIFEEFTQVDASTTRKAGGTGLGLPISRHFVEMHRGEIWVESELGQGTTFSFYVPLSPIPQKQPAFGDYKATEAAPKRESRTIVAVDSDSTVINLYKRYLEKHNYTVIGVTSGKDAIAQVKEHSPFAVLLDIIIPDKDGWKVIKELKHDPFTKNIPVVICSIVEDKNRGFLLGASDYLIKPVVENELVKTLKNLNNRHKNQTKVLVVDDQADDILLMRRILEGQEDYSIIEARDGKEGLELVETNTPDLIILDLKMPEMDGFEMIESLKASEKGRNIPIIVVSAQAPSPEEQNRLTGQVEVILRKGIFTEQDLLEDVKMALGQLTQENQRA